MRFCWHKYKWAQETKPLDMWVNTTTLVNRCTKCGKVKQRGDSHWVLAKGIKKLPDNWGAGFR